MDLIICDGSLTMESAAPFPEDVLTVPLISHTLNLVNTVLLSLSLNL